MGRVPSMGVFLWYPSPYIWEFWRTPQKNSERLGRQVRQRIESGTPPRLPFRGQNRSEIGGILLIWTICMHYKITSSSSGISPLRFSSPESVIHSFLPLFSILYLYHSQAIPFQSFLQVITPFLFGTSSSILTIWLPIHH